MVREFVSFYGPAWNMKDLAQFLENLKKPYVYRLVDLETLETFDCRAITYENCQEGTDLLWISENKGTHVGLDRSAIKKSIKYYIKIIDNFFSEEPVRVTKSAKLPRRSIIESLLKQKEEIKE